MPARAAAADYKLVLVEEAHLSPPNQDQSVGVHFLRECVGQPVKDGDLQLVQPGAIRHHIDLSDVPSGDLEAEDHREMAEWGHDEPHRAVHERQPSKW